MMGGPRLSLAIRNVNALENGVATRIELDQRNAVIGRSAAADWSLPDPRAHISSQHCEIRYEGGHYRLTDRSTNGTSVNAGARLTDAHVIRDGDVINVGHYEIVAKLTGDASAAAPSELERPDWTRWDSSTPGSPQGMPPNSGANDIWGSFADNNVIDWARGGFGAPPPPAVARTPHGAERAVAALLRAAGIERSAVRASDQQLMETAGGLLRGLVSGLVVMMEARARAKSQMGAQTTFFSREGNNPLKFARSPQDALAQLLQPPLSGFMSGERAVEDGFRDLQAHQMAMLKAMQGALRATIDRFSPTSIRERAESKGFFSRLLPGARKAGLWKAYEREFDGVAQGSAEAFIEMFAKEFLKAYEEQSSR